MPILLELALELLHGRHLTLLDRLLHLELHIVEYAVEIDRIQFDRHLDSRVLLEVNQGLLALLRVHHASGSFNAFTLLNTDLLSVENHELDQALDHDHPIVLLAGDRVVDEGKVKQVGQLSQFFDFK